MGNETIFFIEFCILIMAKTVIIVLFTIAVWRYLVARATMVKLIRQFERNQQSLQFKFEQPKMREKLSSLLFVGA